MISSGVRKVLGIAWANITLGIVWGTATSATLASGVSLVSILQAGELVRVSTSGRHYFSAYHTATNQHSDSVQHAVLDHSENFLLVIVKH